MTEISFPTVDLSTVSESVGQQVMGLKQNYEQLLLAGISHDNLTDDSNISDEFELTEHQVDESIESKEACGKPHLDEISNEWVDIPLRDDSNNSFEFEPTEKQVAECHESKEICEQALLDGVSSECVNIPLTPCGRATRIRAGNRPEDPCLSSPVKFALFNPSIFPI